MRLTPFLSLVLLSAPLSAQQRCVDPLAGASYRETPLSVAVTTPAAGDRDRDRYVTGMLTAFGHGYFDPGRGQGGDGGGIQVVGTVPDTAERDPVHATLEVAIDRNGHALSARLLASSGKPALDTALLRAATAAGGQAGYGKVPRKMRGDTLRFTLQVDDRAAPAGAAGLGALSVPYLRADKAPTIRSMPPARAPRGHRGKEVVLAGTVNATGHLIPSTIRVVSTTDSTLIPIARASFERAVYRPGTLHGCPAEATIRQLFRFP